MFKGFTLKNVYTLILSFNVYAFYLIRQRNINFTSLHFRIIFHFAYDFAFQLNDYAFQQRINVCVKRGDLM